MRTMSATLFSEALRIVAECNPLAVMLRTSRDSSNPKFTAYRASIEDRLRRLGYEPRWKLLNASDYGVPQLHRARSSLRFAPSSPGTSSAKAMQGARTDRRGRHSRPHGIRRMGGS